MLDDRGNVVSEATPSTPVEVTGWRKLPSAGDEVVEVKSEVTAKEIHSVNDSVIQISWAKMITINNNICFREPYLKSINSNRCNKLLVRRFIAFLYLYFDQYGTAHM